MKGGAGTVKVVVQVGLVGEEMLHGRWGVRVGLRRGGGEARRGVYERKGRQGGQEEKENGKDGNDR